MSADPDPRRTEYLRDRTIEGMNSGTDLFTLMGEIRLPPELDIPQGHGKVPWIVRAVWEEHVGWFRYESTTELYDVAPSAIWDELTDLAGGPAVFLNFRPLAPRRDRPLHALHFTDIVLARDPNAKDALNVKLRALEQLLAASGREISARSVGSKPRSARQRRSSGDPSPPLSERDVHLSLRLCRRTAVVGRARRPAGGCDHRQFGRLRP